jgi:hypothetical protein
MGLIREKRKIPLSLHNAVSKLETAFFLTATEFATKIRPLLSLSEAQEMDVLLSKMAQNTRTNSQNLTTKRVIYLSAGMWNTRFGTRGLPNSKENSSTSLKN